jgi:hypothetical protein
MRRNTLLASVAVLSLFGSTGIAAAQGMSQGGTAGSQAPAAAAPQEGTAPAAKQPAQTQTNAPAAPGAKSGKTAQDSKAAPQQAQDKPASPTQPKSAASPAADTKTSTTGAAPSGAAAAAPPPEKRSQIVSAIKQEKMTSITNVNFNISIGSRVPSTVHFYPVPTRIIEIYPEWRGYQVILVKGRYIIVRPNTYEIVYIIEG